MGDSIPRPLAYPLGQFCYAAIAGNYQANVGRIAVIYNFEKPRMTLAFLDETLR